MEDTGIVVAVCLLCACLAALMFAGMHEAGRRSVIRDCDIIGRTWYNGVGYECKPLAK